MVQYNITEKHISQNAAIANNKPCISGTRIRVQDVYVWHEINGQSVDDIAREYDLTLSQVYAALTYAFDNLSQIRRDIRASEAFVEDLKQRYPSKLSKD